MTLKESTDKHATNIQNGKCVTHLDFYPGVTLGWSSPLLTNSRKGLKYFPEKADFYYIATLK